MSRKRYFYFSFSDGHATHLTPQEALEYIEENGVYTEFNGYHRHLTATVRVKRDGFTAGYNPALGCHVGGRKHYAQLLKERGLIEAGNEKLNPNQDKDINYFPEESLREIKQEAPDVSDNTLAALGRGEL